LTNWSGESLNWRAEINLNRRIEKLESMTEGGSPYYIDVHGVIYESSISIAEIIRNLPPTNTPPSERKNESKQTD
jgi:hypothetical protein